MMARLRVFAEGQTEQVFVNSVLREHLSARGVYAHAVLVAHARKKGTEHRGGSGSKYLPMKNDIMRSLKRDQNADALFTTMIDLYALPNKFPGVKRARELGHLPYERVKLLEAALAKDVGDLRFIPYIQLHEFEAYLFSKPRELGFFYDDLGMIEKLASIADGYDSPELIDDGPQTAPSKRITKLLPDYEDAKPVVGPQVAARIGLDVIRQRCPHFDDWLSRLESLGE